MNALMSNEHLEPVMRLGRDLRAAAATLSDAEARYLVDAYYLMQENRIRSDHQAGKLAEAGEPNLFIKWLAEQNSKLEVQIRGALDRYTTAHKMGRVMKGVKGIGPVISAGLLANIDIAKAPTVGHIWCFAGLDPTATWNKGEKRPWNGRLKRLCWITGTSFVKAAGGKTPGFYHLLYKDRKLMEVERNEQGAYAEQAKKALIKNRYRDDTAARKAYEAGRLPAAHIQRRAERYAVKIFLSDIHVIWRWLEFGEKPIRPWIIASGLHAHWRMSPTFDLVPELAEIMRDMGATPWALRDLEGEVAAKISE